MISSIEGNFDNPEVNELLTKHFIELRAASPEGSAHVLDIPGLKIPSIKFWSLWENNKLMVHDNFRNKGYGIKVIKHLIDEAKKLNINRISIETGAGNFFKPARKLFKKCNFELCEPFAHYKKDINSLYLTKLISND